MKPRVMGPTPAQRIEFRLYQVVQLAAGAGSYTCRRDPGPGPAHLDKCPRGQGRMA